MKILKAFWKAMKFFLFISMIVVGFYLIFIYNAYAGLIAIIVFLLMLLTYIFYECEGD